MTDREAMKMALEALNLPSLKTQQMLQQRDEAIATLRAALEQPEKEPVATYKGAPTRIYLQVCEDKHCEVPFDDHNEVSWCTTKQNPLDVPYVRADLVAPPQRKPLTNDEIIEMAKQTKSAEPGLDGYILPISFARAIEQAHGIGEKP